MTIGHDSKIIELKNVTKIYKKNGKKITGLNNVTFSVKRGMVFGLLGRNGAGKTTAIKLLLGLLHPNKGELFVLGRPPSDVKAKQKVGYLPETSYLDREFTAKETLLFYGRFFKIDKAVLLKRIDELLSMFGILGYKDTPISAFSKGMAQKVAIIQALLHSPELLILDEPTSGLDPISQREIRDFVRNEKDKGKTILLSTHFLDEAEGLCDHLGILHNGRLLRYGAKDKLLQIRSTYMLRTSEQCPADIIKKYQGTKNTAGEIEIRIGLNEKKEIFAQLKEHKVEIIEFYRERERVSDFFSRVLLGADDE
ncbi:ABC transporter ATP-binding protein [bacterium]|nr:ABC transporter ATP-binding protein [bacterium]